jgi:hypothetical protein
MGQRDEIKTAHVVRKEDVVTIWVHTNSEVPKKSAAFFKNIFLLGWPRPCTAISDNITDRMDLLTLRAHSIILRLENSN